MKTKILHYFLGFPPYRTGGLTKYAFDLMTAQVLDGNKVIALWPGQIKILFKDIKLIKRSPVNGIESYELINPLPVPLDEGITNFKSYMQSCNALAYERFFDKIKPNVIHIHTLMGLHKEFLDVAHKFKIKIVFTTHDCFGLCPTGHFYKHGVSCENDHECNDCALCNVHALSMNKIWFMQSLVYRKLKDSFLIKQIRRYHRNNFFSQKYSSQTFASKRMSFDRAENYKELRNYYIKMLSTMDLIHFNSTLSEKVYKKYFLPSQSTVMTITHKNIKDNRNTCQWKYSSRLRITCLSPSKPFKGYDILISVLDDLWASGKRDFELNLFDAVPDKKPYINVQQEGFSSEQLEKIFSQTDILVALSICYETFGFTVLEAISYGIPVIISDHVGAQDIIGEGGWIVKSGDEKSLKSIFKSINIEKIIEIKKNIQKGERPKIWEEFVKENYKLYQ